MSEEIKVKMDESANWPTTPDRRGIIYIGDDNGSGYGDDGVKWWGRIFCPGRHVPEKRFCFRANEDADDFTADQLETISKELRKLDAARDEVLRATP